MKKNVQNLISSLVVVGVGAWIYIATIGVQSFAAAQIEPQAVPRIVADAMFFLGALMLIKTALTWNEEKKPLSEKAHVAPAGRPWQQWLANHTAFVTFILIFSYIYLMKSLGFIIATTGYLTAQITVLSGIYFRRQILRYLVIAVIIAVIVFFIFNKGFALALPLNAFGF